METIIEIQKKWAITNIEVQDIHKCFIPYKQFGNLGSATEVFSVL